MSQTDPLTPEATDQPDDDDYEVDPEAHCTWCCGDGEVENDDPIQRGPEEFLTCPSCNGTGKRKDMTLW